MSLFGKSDYTFIKVKRKEIPQGIWQKCAGCEAPSYKKELAQNLNVCPRCKFHMLMTATERVALLTDEGSFVEHDKDMEPLDPLKFGGPKTYKEKLKADQEATGLKEAVLTGKAKINGLDYCLSVTDSRFIMGSMGSVVGEKITRAVEFATDYHIPLVIVSGSGGGARMHEGAYSLMQMAKTCAALARHKDAGLLYISVLTNPTMGGVMASFAGVGDIILAEPKALIGFTGPRVIEQTIRKHLPAGFQRSEFLLAHGLIDKIVDRAQMKFMLSQIIQYTQPEEHSA